MKLFKNVDVIDLKSILKNGILSLNESQNDNWEEGRREDNSCDLVYMFKPNEKGDSFTQYGTALMEINIPDELVKENEISENDVNKGKYREYVASKVEAEYITNIYIPEMFRNRIELNDEIEEKITWCGFSANYYKNYELTKATEEILKQFAETAKIMDASEYNFFRGKLETREVVDLYDIKYLF